MSYFAPAEFPTAAIQDVISNVRSGDYVGRETVGAALYAAGKLNAFRGDGDVSVLDADHDPDALRGESLPALCDRLESALPKEGEATAQAPPAWLLPVLAIVLEKLIERLAKKAA
ncbi:hypothetical protein [Alienimonas sp. DA493]|uniref:hypothetical protein n=1 Tax=Alienimonas sp. DA493 TaxID=3373605 RepID=UPI003754179F